MLGSDLIYKDINIEKSYFSLVGGRNAGGTLKGMKVYFIDDSPGQLTIKKGGYLT